MLTGNCCRPRLLAHHPHHQLPDRDLRSAENPREPPLSVVFWIDDAQGVSHGGQDPAHAESHTSSLVADARGQEARCTTAAKAIGAAPRSRSQGRRLANSRLSPRRLSNLTLTYFAWTGRWVRLRLRITICYADDERVRGGVTRASLWR